MTDLLTIAVVVAAWLGVLACIVAVCAAAARADRRDMRVGARRTQWTPQRFPASQRLTSPDRIAGVRSRVDGATAAHGSSAGRRARALIH